MPRRDELIERIGACRIVPVLRTTDAGSAVDAAVTCFAAGLDAVELTATTDGWEAALERLRRDEPERLIGLGTVRDAVTAGRAIDLGADFLVSPCPVPDVRQAIGPALLVEGGWTVGELLDAGTRGPAKLFPASVGGTAYLRSVLAVDPHLRVIPTGGIKLADVPAWLEAGSFAVGVGTDLLRHDDLRRALATELR